MRRTRNQAGEGQGGCLIGLILLVAVGFVSFKMIPVKVKTAELRQAVQDQAKGAGLPRHSDGYIMKVLLAKAGGSKVGVVFPKEGAVVIPGPIALLPHAKESKAARAVYDAILSADVQKIIVEKGGMHSADPAMPTPAGAPKLEELLGKETPASIFDPTADADAIKNEFTKIFAKAENK